MTGSTVAGYMLLCVGQGQTGLTSHHTGIKERLSGELWQRLLFSAVI